MTKRKSRSRRAGKHAEPVATGRPPARSGDQTGPSEFRKRPSFLLLLSIIGSVAFLLRLINVLQTIETPTVVQLLGDAKGYYDWALRIAGGQWYGQETFYQAPLYPYTLAVLIKVFGSGVFGIRLFQTLLGTLSVVFLGVAAKRVFNPVTGLVAAAMYAVYPPAIYYDGIIQKTALASFLLCALLAVCALYQKPRGDRRPAWVTIAMGVVLGLLVLTRENALLWVPIIPLWIWFGFSIPRKARMIGIGWYLTGLALVLAPVAARNASLGGEWSPTTFQAGPNFYIGNNLESNGLYRPLVAGHETPMYERADAQRLAERAEGRELSSREVSSFWGRQALREIGQDPARWIQLMLLKSLMVVNRYEVPDVESMYVYRDYSWPLRLIGPWWHFGILCPLAVWGIVTTRDRWQNLWLLYLLILVMIAAVVLFFILGRYRQPLVALLALFAATALVDLVQRIRTKNWIAVRTPLIAATIALVACNIPVHDESMLNASSYMNLGIAAGKSGNMAVSLKSLAHAVQTHPEMPEAHVNLGRALELTNRPGAAIECYQNALMLDPNLSMVDTFLARNYEKIGDLESAIAHYRRAIQIDPDDLESRKSLDRLMNSR